MQNAKYIPAHLGSAPLRSRLCKTTALNGPAIRESFGSKSNRRGFGRSTLEGQFQAKLEAAWFGKRARDAAEGGTGRRAVGYVETGMVPGVVRFSAELHAGAFA